MMLEDFTAGAVELHHNAAASGDADYPAELAAILSVASTAPARREIMSWRGYEKTPLPALSGLARELGLASIHYKDEGPRFGLGSFKALGGAYEVLSVLISEVSAKTGQPVSAEAIRQGQFMEATADITVTTATDGNHGRSVAWGAQRFGCRCRIYIHAEVSEGRQQAMEAFGAEVVRIDGNYDESVHLAASDAAANGWHLVSDTSYEGYTELPRQVMAGYSVMVEECLEGLGEDGWPSHVFVQGGVGGLAGAVCSYLWDRQGARRPRFIVVEPSRAACLLASARHGGPKVVEIEEETIMAGLSCGEVSKLGWQILAPGANDFIALEDDFVAPAMRLLADSPYGDPPIVAGESAVAGLAALVNIMKSPEQAAALGLGSDSRVLLFGTEGATDREIYKDIVGRFPEEVVG